MRLTIHNPDGQPCIELLDADAADLMLRHDAADRWSIYWRNPDHFITRVTTEEKERIIALLADEEEEIPLDPFKGTQLTDFMSSLCERIAAANDEDASEIAFAMETALLQTYGPGPGFDQALDYLADADSDDTPVTAAAAGELRELILLDTPEQRRELLQTVITTFSELTDREPLELVDELLATMVEMHEEAQTITQESSDADD